MMNRAAVTVSGVGLRRTLHRRSTSWSPRARTPRSVVRSRAPRTHRSRDQAPLAVIRAWPLRGELALRLTTAALVLRPRRTSSLPLAIASPGQQFVPCEAHWSFLLKIIEPSVELFALGVGQRHLGRLCCETLPDLL